MDNEFDVFISHNSQDKPAVQNLVKALKSLGLRVWLDEEQLQPGLPWQDGLQAAIKSTRAAAVLVGKDGLGPWEIPEMQACLAQFVSRQLPVIPVLLPDAQNQPELPLFLQLFTWVDLRSGLTQENLSRLQWGITGINPLDSVGLAEGESNTPTIEHDNKEAKKQPDYSISDAVILAVRAEIGKLMRKSTMQVVGKALLVGQPFHLTTKPEELLVPLEIQPFPVVEKVDMLHDAIRDTFKAFAEERKPIPVTEAKEILEWLLLLAVPDDWVKRASRRVDPTSTSSNNEIAEKYAVWAEVGGGRLELKRPRFELEPGPNPTKVKIPNQLGHDELERGLKNSDALTEVLREIYIKVMKREPPIDEDWKAQLPHILERRRKDDDRYHIAIPHNRYATIAANTVWVKELGEILSLLGVFVYGTGNSNRVLIVPEDKLLVAIREFLILLRKYE